jgi:pimeloyl-ACP methyl ester carboxylesterase
MLKKRCAVYLEKIHPNAKKILVFIHGSWGSGEHFVAYAEELYRKGYTVYVLTLPGHGTGNPQDVKGFSVMDYVWSVTREIENIGVPCILIGHSMGGLISQKIAEMCPRLVEKIVLINSAPPRGIWLINPEMTLRILTSWHYLNPMITGGPLTVLVDEQGEFLFNDSSVEEKEVLATMLGAESGKALLEMSTLSISVEEIRCPVCSFVASYDNLIPLSIGGKIAKRYSKNPQSVSHSTSGGHYSFLKTFHKLFIIEKMLEFFEDDKIKF